MGRTGPLLRGELALERRLLRSTLPLGLCRTLTTLAVPLAPRGPPDVGGAASTPWGSVLGSRKTALGPVVASGSTLKTEQLKKGKSEHQKSVPDLRVTQTPLRSGSLSSGGEATLKTDR